MHEEKKKRKGLEKNNLRVMKKEEIVAKNKIEKESIALFKKNLLKESYNWFKDTDYFVKIKNDNKYSNIENKTETKNVVTGRVQLGWGGTFFLLCCVVVICDNSGWQSCNHYNNNIFYSPESLTVVYSFLYIVYAFPLFIFHQCLGLVSQGNYVKSCRMLSPYMGILSIFSLFGTITFCAKEICNFSIEFLQNVIRLSDRSEEKKYGMTKIFIDLTSRGKDCSSLPNTMYVESIDQCISFNDEVIVNFYENLWFISNRHNYIYLIFISTLFLLFCYFILLRENFRVFKFFIFVIIINWITTKSVVIMNTFFFYIPQQKKIYEEIILIFREIGILRLTIFLYGTLARSSSIFILSTFASYFHTNTNILKISLYTFVFYILNMYFYLKNEAHEYYLYNKNFGNMENYNFMKCNTYINMLHQLNEEETGSAIPNTYGGMYAVWQKLCLFFSSYSFLFSTVFIVLMQLLGPFNILSEEANYRFEQDDDKKVYTYKSLVKKYEKYDLRHNVSDNKSYTSSHYSKKKSVISASENWEKKKIDLNKSEKKKKFFFFNLHFFKKKIKKKCSYTQGGKSSHVEGQTSSLRKTISFKDINIKQKKRKDNSSFYTSRKSSLFINEDSKNYSLSNFPKGGKKTSSYECYYGDRTNFNFEESSLENYVNMENEIDNRQMKNGGGKNEAPIYAKGENSRNAIHIGHYSGSSGEGESSFFDWTESDVSIGIMREDKQRSGYSRARHKMDEGEETCEEGGVQMGTYKVTAVGNEKSDGEKRGDKKRDDKKRGGTKRGVDGRDGDGCKDEGKGKKCNVISKTISRVNKIILRKYGTFLLFFVIYVFTILHIVDFKRNNNIVSEIILYNLYRSFLIFILTVQVIYSSWIFGMRLQMTQCGVISCLLNFITWVVILPLLFLIYIEKKLWVKLIITGIFFNTITIITSYVEVFKKIKERKLKTSNVYNNILDKCNKWIILKKCLYWLYIGNLEILRKNINIAISGYEDKYIPFFWSIVFKYVNSFMLIVIIIYNTNEYFLNMLDIFESTFSFQIELISILIIFLGSFILLINNVCTGNTS
ncbi:conserved Plasmodium protein, unknown function [Plasmodium ovale]|uniref:Transporter n=1 Tax=Plasmodium ovale TaxID=36330 RepID=A0A1C3KRZ4_PLAOA|nr:conserved Plasmodium protein, unknown function [Plasmodium ovale]